MTKTVNSEMLNYLFREGHLPKSILDESLDVHYGQKLFSITDIEITDMQDGSFISIPGVTFVFDLEGSSVDIRDNGEASFIEKYSCMFKELTHIIYSNKGIVEKFPGDGISAHFLKEQDVDISLCTKNAANAACEIQKYMNDNNYIGYRISMWTGSSTKATFIGDNHHRELISIGHAVNVAHKLEKYVKEEKYTLGMDRNIVNTYSELTGISLPSEIELHYGINNNYKSFELPENLQDDSNKYWYGVKENE